MYGVDGEPLARYALAVSSFAPIQASDTTSVLEAPPSLRALAAFVLVAVLGGLLVWRHESFVERSIDASMARPLSSLVYGVAAHGVVAFGAVYLATQLGGFEIAGYSAGAVGPMLGLLLALLAGSLGFTVVGSTLVGIGWERRRWNGLAVGALIAGVAGLLDPLVGGILWFVVVSMGIGGPARRWLHADATPDP